VKNKLLLFALFVSTVVTDQLSKFAIDRIFELYEAKRILGTFFYLRYIRNSGFAFGFSFGNPLFMVILTILIILTLGYLFLREKLFSDNILGKVGMVLVLGGAVGNLIDRIRMHEVIDFFDMGIGSHRWPVYNLADVYVTIGMVTLIYLYTFKTKPQYHQLHNSDQHGKYGEK